MRSNFVDSLHERVAWTDGVQNFAQPYHVLRGFDRTSQPRPRISVVTVPTLKRLEVKVQHGTYRSWGKCSVRAIEAHATVGSDRPKVCVTRKKLLTG
jgi:hypothetical protein